MRIGIRFLYIKRRDTSLARHPRSPRPQPPTHRRCRASPTPASLPKTKCFPARWYFPIGQFFRLCGMVQNTPCDKVRTSRREEFSTRREEFSTRRVENSTRRLVFAYRRGICKCLCMSDLQKCQKTHFSCCGKSRHPLSRLVNLSDLAAAPVSLSNA